MGLSSAIDWWDQWRLRILVVCSLLVQFLLFFAGYVCQWYDLRRLRVIVWLAYIGGDALAVYALATLFNRQKQQQTAADGGGGSSALEVTWAE
jgi:O-antigen ligase